MFEKYRIGVLAAQGAFEEHLSQIESLNHKGIRITTAEQLETIDALILPGGESTAIGLMLKEHHLIDLLRDIIGNGLPVWGTCAGMILLAKTIKDSHSNHLDLMDITVKRNAYGRQSASFICEHLIPEIAKHPLSLVFVRAPYIVDYGPCVTVLATYENKIIAAQEKNMLVTSFHPELTSDTSTLKYFIKMIKYSPY